MGMKLWGVLGLAAASTLAAVVSLVQLTGERQKLAEEREKTQQLAASSQALTSTVAELRAQIQTLLERVASLQKPQIENSAIPVHKASLVTEGAPRRGVRPASSRAAASARRPADDPRWQQLQKRIAENQKEISGTKEQLNQTRDDLESKLNLAREDLGGSIARTNQELTALQKRGERDYFAFELSKSKQFQRVGPIRVSLRKVNVKKRTYDLVLMADDAEIQKKGVFMLEPVWITIADRPQPLELVVNQVRKDQVEGYVSAAKYKKSELAGGAGQSEPRPELSRRD